MVGHTSDGCVSNSEARENGKLFRCRSRWVRCLESLRQPGRVRPLLHSSLAIRQITDDPSWVEVTRHECEEIHVTSGMKTVIYPVKDLTAAKKAYGTLFGVAPYADEPYYVGFNVAGQEVGLDPNGHSTGMSGPVGYWHVDDINESLKHLVDAGAETQQPVRDVGGGKLIATVKDADGNMIGLLQAPAGGWTS